MADKTLDADHPQRRTRRPKRRTPNTADTLTRCGCGRSLTPAMLPTHTCAYLKERRGFNAVIERATAGDDNATAKWVLGVPCVDYGTDYTREAFLRGSDRVGDYLADRRDPFWPQLAADLTLARQRCTDWARQGIADALASLSIKLMRLGAIIAPLLLLTACTAPTARPVCTVTGVDTLWFVNTAQTDSLPAIITTEWCE